ncbi:MAG TPA: hypothetical protein VMB03_26785 [Bryobacteraceae bacterium]|nr:hypothetical protein [Bryobacteraceae bacterium]
MSSNWWATAWVEKMQRLAEPSRFADGMAYLRGNHVQRCRLEGRTVIANVQARQEQSSAVRITFEAFSREQWEALFANLRDRRAVASSLAMGELPLEVQTAFAKAKLRFMPERYVDLHLECGCADWLKPCKHLVAAWLKFGRDFERDPLLLFELRGIERKELVDLLRGDGTTVAERDDGPEEEFDDIPVRLEKLPADPDLYWAETPLPAAETGARRLADEDLFAKLGPAPLPGWSAAGPQLHRVYDAVFELASILLRGR